MNANAPSVVPSDVPALLLPAVLAALGDGATLPDVGERLRAFGLAPTDALLASLAAELERLGLARIASGHGEAAVRVRTTLGDSFAAAASAGADVRDRLADLETLRSDLLATISHELRTPLTAIRTSIGLLLDPTSEPTAEQHQTLLETIGRNADRMARLTADVLDLARFRQGRIVLQQRTFDAAGITADAAATLAPLAARAGQTIALLAPPSPVPVYGDRPRLEQALINLLSNALRFSPRGAEVLVETASDGETVRWSVTDHGAGIPEDDKERLFERFFVGATARPDGRAAREGTGLGLPIALAIAQAHGGEIDVVSEVGAGSTFTLLVPAQAREDAS